MCLKKLLDFDVLDLSIICLLSPNGISQGIQGIIDFFSIVCLNVVASKAVIVVFMLVNFTFMHVFRASDCFLAPISAIFQLQTF